VNIALLDADDVWLPEKLEQQVTIMNSHPKVGMVYGDTLYWYSWTNNPEDLSRDFIPLSGVEPNVVIKHPSLLPMYLLGNTFAPCTCSVLIRRAIVKDMDGFDETFTGANNIYEDQAFYAKLCLRAPVYIANTCWDRYRQHPAAYVSSYKRLDWSHPFSHFLNQPLLMKDYLAPYQNEIEDFTNNNYDVIDQEVLLWKLAH
jgi:hypothetical protein